MQRVTTFACVMGWFVSAIAVASGAPIPILHYTFDSADISGTTVTDQGSGGFTGTIVGDKTLVAGQFGDALSFDPSTGAAADFVKTATSVLTTTALPSGYKPYTIAAWVKFTDTTPLTSILGQYDGTHSWALFMNYPSADDLSWYHAAGFVNYNFNFNDGVWHQIVYTRNAAGALQLYVDGSLTALASTDSFDDVWAGRFTVGADDPAGGSPFKGAMDEIYVFDTVLSAAQVSTLHSVNAVPEPAAIVLLAPLAGVLLRRRATGGR